MKRYTLRVEVDLDPRDAIDDVAAREIAMTQFAEMHLERQATPTVRVKLQEIREGEAPAARRFQSVSGVAVPRALRAACSTAYRSLQ